MTKEEKLRKFACEIGVKGRDDDEVYIKKINEMESRDKSVFGKKEARNVSK